MPEFKWGHGGKQESWIWTNGRVKKVGTEFSQASDVQVTRPVTCTKALFVARTLVHAPELAAAENKPAEAIELLAETESRQRVDRQLGREPQPYAAPPLIAELSPEFFQRIAERGKELESPPP